MTLNEAFLKARADLAAHGSDSAGLDAQLLLSKVTALSRTALIVHDDKELSEAESASFEALIKKRATGYPVAYLLGYKDFWGLRLKVTEDTLIPRPDTETVVEEALKEDFRSALDLGTGSGALILALKSERPDGACCACDLSEKALEVAKENAQTLGLEVGFYKSSWFACPELAARRFDLIVSNPPYIEARDPHLRETSLPFEPRQALVSGEDGLDDLRATTAAAPAHVNTGGRLLTEHGFDQGERVRALFEMAGFSEVKTVRDLGGNERVTCGRKPR